MADALDGRLGTGEEAVVALARVSRYSVGDVIVYGMHCSSFEEMCAAWERRKAKANPKKTIILLDSWNCSQNAEVMEEIMNLGYPYLLISDLPQHKGMKHCLYLSADKYQTGMGAFPSPNPLGISKDGYRRSVERDFDLYGELFAMVRAMGSQE